MEILFHSIRNFRHPLESNEISGSLLDGSSGQEPPEKTSRQKWDSSGFILGLTQKISKSDGHHCVIS